MVKSVFALLFGAVLLAACARTEIVGLSGPAYRDAQFDSVVVIAHGFPLEEQQRLENSLAQLFAQEGVQAWTGDQLAVPTRQMPQEELVQQAGRVGAETVLTVTVAETGFDRSPAPVFFSPGRTYGGGTITQPIRSYEVVLLDVSNGSTVWQGDAGSRGSELASFSTLDESFARELFDALIDTGVFAQSAG